MSGLDLICGYGSDADEDENSMIVTSIHPSINDNAKTVTVVERGGVHLPSAAELLGCTSGGKRPMTSFVEKGESPNKISRIMSKHFIPPQIGMVRPNIVTEDTKHK